MPSLISGCSVTRHAKTPQQLPAAADGPSTSHETWVTAPVDYSFQDANPHGSDSDDSLAPPSFTSSVGSEEDEYLRAAAAVARRNATLRNVGRNSASRQTSLDTSLADGGHSPASQQSVRPRRTSMEAGREDQAKLQGLIQRASMRLSKMEASGSPKTAQEMLADLRRGVSDVAPAAASPPAAASQPTPREMPPCEDNGSETEDSASDTGAGSAALDLWLRAAARLEALESAGEACPAEQMLHELRAGSGVPPTWPAAPPQPPSYAPSESDAPGGLSYAPSEASTTLEELLAAAASHHTEHLSAVALLQELRSHPRRVGGAPVQAPPTAPAPPLSSNGSSHTARLSAARCSPRISEAVAMFESIGTRVSLHGGAAPLGRTQSSTPPAAEYPPSESPSEASTTLEELTARAERIGANHKSADALLAELRGQTGPPPSPRPQPVAASSGVKNPAAMSPPTPKCVASESPSGGSNSLNRLAAEAGSSSASHKSAEDMLAELRGQASPRSSPVPHQRPAPAVSASHIVGSISAATPLTADDAVSEASTSLEELTARAGRIGASHKSAEDMLAELRGQASPRSLPVPHQSPAPAVSASRSLGSISAAMPLTADDAASEASTSLEELTACAGRIGASHKSAEDMLAELRGQASPRSSPVPHQSPAPAVASRSLGSISAATPPAADDAASEASTSLEELTARTGRIGANHKSAEDMLADLRGQAGPPSSPAPHQRPAPAVSAPHSVGSISAATPLATDDAVSEASTSLGELTARAGRIGANHKSAQDMLAELRGQAGPPSSPAPHQRPAPAVSASHSVGSISAATPPAADDAASEASTSLEELTARAGRIGANHKSAEDMLAELRGQASPRSSPVPHQRPAPAVSASHSLGSISAATPLTADDAASEASTSLEELTARAGRIGADHKPAQDMLAELRGQASPRSSPAPHQSPAPAVSASHGVRSISAATPPAADDAVSEASTSLEELTARAGRIGANHKSAEDMLAELRGQAGPAPPSPRPPHQLAAASTTPDRTGKTAGGAKSAPAAAYAASELAPEASTSLEELTARAGRIGATQQSADQLLTPLRGQAGPPPATPPPPAPVASNGPRRTPVASPRMASASDSEPRTESDNGDEVLLATRAAPLRADHLPGYALLAELRGQAEPTLEELQAVVAAGISRPPPSPAARFQQALEDSYYPLPAARESRASEGSVSRPARYAYAASDSESGTSSEATTSSENWLAARAVPVASNHKSADAVLAELRGRAAPGQRLPSPAALPSLGRPDTAAQLPSANATTTSAPPPSPSAKFEQALQSAYSGAANKMRGAPLPPGAQPSRVAFVMIDSECDSDPGSEDSSATEDLLAARAVLLDRHHQTAEALLAQLKGGPKPLAHKPQPQPAAVSDAKADGAASPMAVGHLAFESPSDTVSEASTGAEDLAARTVAVGADHKSAQDLLAELRGQAAPKSPPVAVRQAEARSVGNAKAGGAVSQAIAAWEASSKSSNNPLAARAALLAADHKSADDMLAELKRQAALKSPAVAARGRLAEVGAIGGDKSNGAVPAAVAASDASSETSSETEDLLAARAAPLAANHKSADDMLAELKGQAAPKSPAAAARGRQAEVGAIGGDKSNGAVPAAVAASDASSETSSKTEDLLAARAAPLAADHKSADDMLAELKRQAAPKSPAAAARVRQAEVGAIGNATTNGAVPAAVAASDASSETSSETEDLLAARAAPLAADHKSAGDMLAELKGQAAPGLRTPAQPQQPQELQQQQKRVPTTPSAPSAARKPQMSPAQSFEEAINKSYSGNCAAAVAQSKAAPREATAGIHKSAEELLRELRGQPARQPAHAGAGRPVPRPVLQVAAGPSHRPSRTCCFRDPDSSSSSGSSSPGPASLLTVRMVALDEALLPAAAQLSALKHEAAATQRQGAAGIPPVAQGSPARMALDAVKAATGKSAAPPQPAGRAEPDEKEAQMAAAIAIPEPDSSTGVHFSVEGGDVDCIDRTPSSATPSPSTSQPLGIPLAPGGATSSVTPAECAQLGPDICGSPEHECAVLLVQELRDRAAIAHRLMEEYTSRPATRAAKRLPGCSVVRQRGCRGNTPRGSPALVAVAGESFGSVTGAAEGDDGGSSCGDSASEYFDTDSDMASVTSYASSSGGRPPDATRAAALDAELAEVERQLAALRRAASEGPSEASTSLDELTARAERMGADLKSAEELLAELRGQAGPSQPPPSTSPLPPPPQPEASPPPVDGARESASAALGKAPLPSGPAAAEKEVAALAEVVAGAAALWPQQGRSGRDALAELVALARRRLAAIEAARGPRGGSALSRLERLRGGARR
eukprot:jgi/Tetstr1/436177/TSEL_025022.t1